MLYRIKPGKLVVPEGLDPYIFQRDCVYLVDKFRGRALIGDEPGLGKTIETLLWMHNHPEVMRALVVCPAHLLWHWRREAQSKFEMNSTVLRGRTPREYPIRKLTLINYDILKDWVNLLCEDEFQLIVFDEIHKLTNPEAQWSRAAEKISRLCPYFLGLTGTPISHSPGDLWFPLHLAQPRIWKSRFDFGLRYCYPRKMNGKWVYRGAVKKRMPELHRILRRKVLIRRTKKEVLKDLPKKARRVITLDIERKEYELAEQDFRKWLQKYHPKRANSARREDGRIQAGYLLRLAAKLKMPSIRAWLDDFFLESNEKIMFFAINRSMVEELHEAYPQRSVLVHGGVSNKMREVCFDRFNTDSKCDLFIGNIDAAGTGWSAKHCSNVCFGQLAWNPNAHLQAEDRGHGIGRGGGRALFAYYLIAHGTIEEDLAEMLQDKNSIASAILDGKMSGKDFDLFDELVRVLKRKWL